jgi:hypothetical protein
MEVSWIENLSFHLWEIPEIMPQSACDVKLQNPCNLGQLRNSPDHAGC